MKATIVTLYMLVAFANASDPDIIAREAIRNSAFISNGLSDRTEEDRLNTILYNASSRVALFMASEDVPMTIQVAYALTILRGNLVSHNVGKEVNGLIVVDEAATQEDRKVIFENIRLLERHYLELCALEAATINGEQTGTGQPATRPESKSEGSDKPQPEAEGRSR